ncbi:helix-turn-helix domain-containing protein [Maritimibacter sp. UBA3975]|uniref:ArsR/SmtB family transcription factor n=1 Tax=Maritimibacter sp. UBA3975 TaxID=1946833 RepID=UPI000C0B6761|nr:helix-turn-helix domain-containing protein [Maritimibacter sp. UBA3975]MAM62951.1 ArsR family transcriptional regulator [Maritimibacter sp.]
MTNSFLLITPETGREVLRSLALPARLDILKLLHEKGAMNVNDIAAELGLPQSSTSTHVAALEAVGLIETESRKARKGSQKICRAVRDEIVLSFGVPKRAENEIEVLMPVGLYSGAEVSAPCGLCADTGIIGYLDSPETFLNPDRMKAGLLWFTRGHVDYQFPNNARIAGRAVTELELSLELSSEVPGTSANWPSDITIEINGTSIGTWTAPGDYGDKRGTFTPSWWKLAGSQYGLLKSFRVTHRGTFLDGEKLSDVTLSDLAIDDHRSIRLRIAVPERAEHPGGINIFGRGFGNHDQDISLILRT